MIKRAMALALLLAACTETATEQDSFPAEAIGPILTEDDLRMRVVGRTLYFGSDSVVIEGDGRLSGNVSGEALTGTWYWEEGLWCRTVTSEQELALTDCQVFEVTEEGLRVTGERGTGRTFVYTLSPSAPA